VDKSLVLWAVTLAVGALNFASRLSFIAWFSRNEMPPLLARALHHVPVAMLTAIAVPAVLFIAPATLDLSWRNPRLIAALMAAALAWWRRSTVLTMAVGMGTLWLTRWLLG
jgi:branched-subunit amino acid transport protein